MLIFHKKQHLRLIASSRTTSGLFNEREDLVQKAVGAGVLSNSDYLELQSLKNEILSEQAQSVFQSKTSASFLRTSLGNNYDAAMAELVNRYSSDKWFKIIDKNSNQISLLGLKKTQIQTEIELQKLSNTLTTNWQSTVSSPKSRGAGSTLFAGITMGLPINDGGKSLATIAALAKRVGGERLGGFDFSARGDPCSAGLLIISPHIMRTQSNPPR